MGREFAEDAVYPGLLAITGACADNDHAHPGDFSWDLFVQGLHEAHACYVSAVAVPDGLDAHLIVLDIKELHVPAKLDIGALDLFN